MTDIGEKDYDEFFGGGVHEDAMDSVEETLLLVLDQHKPTDNRSCSCGEVGAFKHDTGTNIRTSAHIREVVMMTIIIAFERARKDVMRVDPGDDDPLAPDDYQTWQTEAWRKWGKYSHGGIIRGTSGSTGTAMHPGVSMHGGTIPAPPPTPPRPSWFTTGVARSTGTT